MRIVILLLVAASGLSVGGCEKQPSPTDTPVATNAAPATPAPPAAPAMPRTNAPAK